MMKYGNLNLKGLREKLDLDFAHFTYVNNYCSCCYGPSEFPSLYWKDRKVIDSNDTRYDHINYILFRNSSNGSGQVTKNDIIGDLVFIEHSLESQKLVIEVCKELFEQVKPYGYSVLLPQNNNTSIGIVNMKNLSSKSDLRREVENLMYNTGMELLK